MLHSSSKSTSCFCSFGIKILTSRVKIISDQHQRSTNHPFVLPEFNYLQHFIYSILVQYKFYCRVFPPQLGLCCFLFFFLSGCFRRQLRHRDILNTSMSEDKKCQINSSGFITVKNLDRVNECVSSFTLQHDIYECVNKVYCNFTLVTRLGELFKMSCFIYKPLHTHNKTVFGRGIAA